MEELPYYREDESRERFIIKKEMETGKEVDMVNQTKRQIKKTDGADKMSGKNEEINNHI